MSRPTISFARPIAIVLALELFVLASGCQGPTTGPTAPLEFMKEGRQWVRNPPPMSPDGVPQTINPHAPAVPVDPAATLP